VKRVVALVGAVAMIAAALAIRARLDDDGDGGSSSSGGRATIACVTELEAACRAALDGTEVSLRVEDAGRTASALAAGSADIDGWVTFAPWPEVANAKATTTVMEQGTPMASTALSIAVVGERTAALTTACGGTAGWRCLGDLAGTAWSQVSGGRPEWGPIRVGLPPPTEGLGLLLYGNAVSGFFGSAAIATNDFGADDAFRPWQNRIRSSFSSGAFAAFIQQFPAALSAVGVTDAALTTGSGTRRDQITVLTPTPPANANVVVAATSATRRGGRVRDVAQSRRLSTALNAAGYGPARPVEESGLPPAGVLLALSGL
jgi:hypothetical protein